MLLISLYLIYNGFLKHKKINPIIVFRREKLRSNVFIKKRFYKIKVKLIQITKILFRLVTFVFINLRRTYE
jgi:hypothetical protein